MEFSCLALNAFDREPLEGSYCEAATGSVGLKLARLVTSINVLFEKLGCASEFGGMRRLCGHN